MLDWLLHPKDLPIWQSGKKPYAENVDFPGRPDRLDHVGRPATRDEPERVAPEEKRGSRDALVCGACKES
jgi:hypothetical protein